MHRYTLIRRIGWQIPRTAVLLVLLGGAAAPTLVAAGPAADVIAAAQVHLDRGYTFFDQKEFQQAVAEFRAAQALVPAPLNLYNIARALQEDGKLEEALAEYRAYLARPDQAERQTKAEAQVRRLKEQLYGDLELVCEPPGATVVLEGPGGVVRGACPWPTGPLKAGPWRLTIEASGHRKVERTVTIEPGGTRFEKVALAILPGRLVVTSIARSVPVLLDGVLVGHTPRVELELAPGPHQLEVAFTQATPLKRELSVHAGERVVLQADPPGSGLSWWWYVGGGAVLVAGAAVTAAMLLAGEDTHVQEAEFGDIQLAP